MPLGEDPCGSCFTDPTSMRQAIRSPVTRSVPVMLLTRSIKKTVVSTQSVHH